jgi:hypothetical protein
MMGKRVSMNEGGPTEYYVHNSISWPDENDRTSHETPTRDTRGRPGSSLLFSQQGKLA